MSRSWIVCATCRESWPIQAISTTYLEMQLESQPCPRCEAYTLSCVATRRPVGIEPSAFVGGSAEPLAEAWRATEG